MEIEQLERKISTGEFSPICGFESEPYFVSTEGIFISVRQGGPRVIRCRPNSVGVLSISLRKDSRWVPSMAAQLVLNTFKVEQLSTLDVPIYKDGDLNNISLSNLGWGGSRELSKLIATFRLNTRIREHNEERVSSPNFDHEYQSFFKTVKSKEDELFNSLLNEYLKLQEAVRPFKDFKLPEQFNVVNRNDPIFFLTDGYQLRYRDLYRLKAILENNRHEELITSLRSS